ncbi:Hypothetical_protein [Hexamita inflata]|uniref:Hypothetical_protein n=1 Tax=Hexamita inflata TaxID=28002 RepID=A0AA86R8T5_9EUKA|nr:Hypothetical protein HINF_LOCUS59292 [Hexamita inflata]
MPNILSMSLTSGHLQDFSALTYQRSVSPTKLAVKHSYIFANQSVNSALNPEILKFKPSSRLQLSSSQINNSPEKQQKQPPKILKQTTKTIKENDLNRFLSVKNELDRANFPLKEIQFGEIKETSFKVQSVKRKLNVAEKCVFEIKPFE